MTRTLPLSLLVLLLVLPAAAQDYGVVALQSDLADGGTLTDPIPYCLDYRPGLGDFVFFDDANDLLASYDPEAPAGSRTTVLRTAAEIDADLGTDIVTCRDLDTDDDGNVYFGAATADNLDSVYRVTADGSSGLVLTDPNAADTGDGIAGLVVNNDGTLLYLARSQFFGSPEDGLYRLGTFSPAQEPEPVVTDGDLDLTGIGISSSGDLYATSSEFGNGAFQNVIVEVADPEGSATLSTVAEPCSGGSPVFVNCEDGGLEDLKVGVRNGDERLFVFNNSFGGPEGEVVAQFDLDGSNPEVVFTESAFLGDPDVSGAGVTEYTPAGTGNGYLDYFNGTLYFAGSASFDGTPGIFEAALGGGGVATEPGAPEAAFALDVWPNPTADGASVRVTVDAAQALEVAAYDLLGRRVDVLFSGTALAGEPVTARLAVSALPAGVYVVRATGETGATMRRVTVVR